MCRQHNKCLFSQQGFQLYLLHNCTLWAVIDNSQIPLFWKWAWWLCGPPSVKLEKKKKKKKTAPKVRGKFEQHVYLMFVPCSFYTFSSPLPPTSTLCTLQMESFSLMHMMLVYTYVFFCTRIGLIGVLTFFSADLFFFQRKVIGMNYFKAQIFLAAWEEWNMNWSCC